MIIELMTNRILMLPRLLKQSIVILIDVCTVIFSVWLAFYLRLGEVIPVYNDHYWKPQNAIYGALLISFPVFFIFDFYRSIFRFSEWKAQIAIARAIGVYSLFYATVFMAVGVEGVPRTIGVIQPILLLFGVGSSRALARFWLGQTPLDRGQERLTTRVLIFGAGVAGRELAVSVASSVTLKIMGFIDDDKRLHGQTINGVKVLSADNLSSIVEKFNVETVLLAVPSATRAERKHILNRLLAVKVSVRTVPSVTDVLQGRANIGDLTDVDLDDLLGREPIEPSQQLLRKNIVGRVVMVTGAGGSIGSELARHVMLCRPSKILLIEQSEFALYALHQELIEKYPSRAGSIICLLASVRDQHRLSQIMSIWRPQTVYHCAAYKHVPIVEQNPAEGILNNVFGTLVAVRTATEFGVSHFVLISTDKAVRPTNIMGASKRIAELILQSFAASRAVENSSSPTIFSIVRFGNVLGSSGSVVPKFLNQIKKGGPVTLTHPEITRYFMSVTEAAQLVIQAGAMAVGGEVFVLDMLDPVRIRDLAVRMIKLNGLAVRDEDNPHGDIEIAVTGLRPGEKLFEELLIGNNPEFTDHARIMKAQEDFFSWLDLEPQLLQLEEALSINDIVMIRFLIQKLVPGYVPTEDIADLFTVGKY
jgi:FlaA1/EpsC-like NDP-sugar epimerase